MSTLQYRRTKKGEWVIMGAPSELKPHSIVAVKTKAGKIKHEEIGRVGKQFATPQGPRVYGYILKSDRWEHGYCAQCARHPDGMCERCAFDEYDM